MGGVIGGECGEWVFDGVVFEEVKCGGEFFCECFFEMCVEGVVFFDGLEFGVGGEECGGECVEIGVDFDDDIVGGDLGEFEGFVDDVVVDEEVLFEEVFW